MYEYVQLVNFRRFNLEEDLVALSPGIVIKNMIINKI